MTRITFGEFELDFARYELSKAGCRIDIPRREMDVLALLVRNADRLVTRPEIAAVLWPAGAPQNVNATITTIVYRVRGILGDDPAAPRFIKLIAGKGYRFVGVDAPAHPRCEYARVKTVAAVAVPGSLLLLLPLAPYGIAIALFILSAAVLLTAATRFHDTTLTRAAVSLFVAGAASFSLSAWNLSEVSRSIVNMEVLQPAALYPLVTGLRFIPAFIVVLMYWIALGARHDSGLAASARDRTTYWTVTWVFFALTMTGIALAYGDYQIWVSGLPERTTIFCCYLAIFAINVAVATTAFHTFNRAHVDTYTGLCGACAVAFAALAIPAIVVDHSYAEVNRNHLDKRRTARYVASNPDAIVIYRHQIALARPPNVGPDLADLVNDRDFERALRSEPFYRQDFDEPFQLGRHAVILAYRAGTGSPADSRRRFVFVRFPDDLVRALRFQFVGD